MNKTTKTPAAPKIMDTSEYVRSRELQSKYKQRIYPDVDFTYNDVIGDPFEKKEVDGMFYKKNLDYATFAKGFEPLKQRETRHEEVAPKPSRLQAVGIESAGQHQMAAEDHRVHQECSFFVSQQHQHRTTITCAK